MNPFDMVILVILGYCLILGIFRGFIKEAASIAAVVGGFFAAYAGHESFASLAGGFIDTPACREIFAFVVIFLAVCLAVYAAGALLRLLVKIVLLGAVDRFFGGVLGIIKGMAVCSLIFILLMVFLPAGGKHVAAESRLAPYVNTVSRTLVHVIPSRTRSAFMKGIEELEESWTEGRTGEKIQ